jgi:hypothetical protein
MLATSREWAVLTGNALVGEAAVMGCAFVMQAMILRPNVLGSSVAQATGVVLEEDLAVLGSASAMQATLATTVSLLFATRL